MNRAILLATAAAIGCAERSSPGTSVQPIRRAPSELATVIRQQAYESRLSIDGIAFLDSVLFVGTNVGLLEVRSLQISQLYQWFANDNVVSGPWSDQTRNRIWMQRDHDNILLTYDHAEWRKVDLPPAPHGYYTRGDILEGFRTAADSTNFWLIGAGGLWRWSEPEAKWVSESVTPPDTLNGIVGFAQLGNRQVYVVSSGGCGYLSCVNQAYWRDGERWNAPIHLATRSVAQVLAASNAIYVRGDSGELLRLERDSAVSLTTPGPCEAVARTSEGKLIASFRRIGLFVLDARWRKLFDDPSPGVVGDRFAYIAEREGTIAFATSTVPQLKPGSSDRWFQSGELGLWMSDGSRLLRLPLAAAQ